jgi:hypothetical protein
MRWQTLPYIRGIPLLFQLFYPLIQRNSMVLVGRTRSGKAPTQYLKLKGCFWSCPAARLWGRYSWGSLRIRNGALQSQSPHSFIWLSCSIHTSLERFWMSSGGSTHTVKSLIILVQSSYTSPWWEAHICWNGYFGCVFLTRYAKNKKNKTCW